MRDIDLNQFWPQYAPPPRLAVAHPPVPADEQRDSELPRGLIIERAPSLAASQAPLFDHEATIQEALAAGAAGWLPSADATRGTGERVPAAPHDREPAQLLLDLRGSDADERAAAAIASAATAASPAKAEKPAAAPVLRETHRTRKRRDFTPVLWGGAGFLAGVLAWHMVGFWVFVSDVVLNANNPRASTLEAFLPSFSSPAASQKVMSRIPETSVIPAPQTLNSATIGTQFACVSLALDRAAGITNAQVCKGSNSDLRDAGFNRRTDRLALRPRLQDPVAWTDTTAVQVSDAAPSISAEEEGLPPLSDADLKLDLD